MNLDHFFIEIIEKTINNENEVNLLFLEMSKIRSHPAAQNHLFFNWKSSVLTRMHIFKWYFWFFWFDNSIMHIFKWYFWFFLFLKAPTEINQAPEFRFSRKCKFASFS